MTRKKYKQKQEVNCDRDGNSGRFISRYGEERKVRTMRLTHTTWRELDIQAKKLNVTRADLIESIVSKGLLEKLINEAASTSPGLNDEDKTVTVSFRELNEYMDLILEELREELKTGKSAKQYKIPQKSLKKMISLIFSSVDL